MPINQGKYKPIYYQTKIKQKSTYTVNIFLKEIQEACCRS